MFEEIKQLDKKTKTTVALACALAFALGLIIAWCLSICMMRAHHGGGRSGFRSMEHEYRGGYKNFERMNRGPMMMPPGALPQGVVPQGAPGVVQSPTLPSSSTTTTTVIPTS